MPLTRIELENFTAFSKLALDLSPGINVVVGANGTGKTHLMKVCYAACEAYRQDFRFAEKLVRVFLPSGSSVGRLVTRKSGSNSATIRVFRGKHRIVLKFSNHTTSTSSLKAQRARIWRTDPLNSVYIPGKELLANAPGFRSLHASREIHFDDTYADIIDRAYVPPLRESIDAVRKRVLRTFNKAIGGRVTVKNEEFFLSSRQGNIEFSLLAEGTRKLALLWILVQNGTLRDGTVLMWDEPETNLNPGLFGTVIDVLLELQRTGLQVLLATHDYVILKELDLRTEEGDQVMYHSLYRDVDTGDIMCHSTAEFDDIDPNAISATFDDLYDREIERTIGTQTP